MIIINKIVIYLQYLAMYVCINTIGIRHISKILQKPFVILGAKIFWLHETQMFLFLVPARFTLGTRYLIFVCL